MISIIKQIYKKYNIFGYKTLNWCVNILQFIHFNHEMKTTDVPT